MRTLLLTTFLLGCGGSDPAKVKDDDTETGVPLGCGDGVVDGDEACDDGNILGGDGCTERCAVETGTLELEPNDDPSTATPWDGGLANGALTEADIDCWPVQTQACGAVTVRAVAPCDPGLVLALHHPDGRVVAQGTADVDGCALIDPLRSPGADQTLAGSFSVCATALGGRVIGSYALTTEVSDVAVGPPGSDQDGDGLADQCDADSDGDGVDNLLDNCPDEPNGPDMGPLMVATDGFIRSWLTLGPVTGTTTVTGCRPSDENTLGVDADAAPELGDTAAGLSWIAWFDANDRIDFRDEYGWADPDREAYAHVYVYSPTARSGSLALGADDGVFSWLNGVQLHDHAGCQGTNVDDFVEPATLLAGWNRLTIKVRDHGGGWGLYARFLDAGGLPMEDLELSLTGAGTWLDDQTDTDGDGIGDVCDPTP